MSSHHEKFWDNAAFAVVGNSAKKGFPRLTYKGLKKLGKTVYPIDPGAEEIEGDKAYAELSALPASVDAVVLEVPKSDLCDWIEQVSAAGITDVWIHMGRETPEGLALAKEKGLEARTGNCAVMYVTAGASMHGLHRWIWKRMGKY